jgi:hypothetical protein
MKQRIFQSSFIFLSFVIIALLVRLVTNHSQLFVNSADSQKANIQEVCKEGTAC